MRNRNGYEHGRTVGGQGGAVAPLLPGPGLPTLGPFYQIINEVNFIDTRISHFSSRTHI